MLYRRPNFIHKWFLPAIVIFLWFIAGGVLGMVLVLWSRTSPRAMPSVAFTPTLPSSLAPTKTPTPTWTILPPMPSATSSPSPTPSPTPQPSPTPTPWPYGSALRIGYSIEHRPIEVYRFGNGPRHRLIVAGIHGGYEWNTVVLAQRLIVYLQGHPELIPPDVTLFILPVLNPDGFARDWGNYGRGNARQVDLNRNFPRLWKSTWKGANCWRRLPLSAGTQPFSEPETRALRDFLLRPDIQVEILVSYHSAALGVFAGGQPPDPRSIDFARAVAKATGYRYPPAGGDCEFTGQLIDWAVMDLGMIAVDVELRTHNTIDWEQNLRLLEVLLHWPALTP